MSFLHFIPLVHLSTMSGETQCCVTIRSHGACHRLNFRSCCNDRPTPIGGLDYFKNGQRFAEQSYRVFQNFIFGRRIPPSSKLKKRLTPLVPLNLFERNKKFLEFGHSPATGPTITIPGIWKTTVILRVLIYDDVNIDKENTRFENKTFWKRQPPFYTNLFLTIFEHVSR